MADYSEKDDVDQLQAALQCLQDATKAVKQVLGSEKAEDDEESSEGEAPKTLQGAAKKGRDMLRAAKKTSDTKSDE